MTSWSGVNLSARKNDTHAVNCKPVTWCVLKGILVCILPHYNAEVGAWILKTTPNRAFSRTLIWVERLDYPHPFSVGPHIWGSHFSNSNYTVPFAPLPHICLSLAPKTALAGSTWKWQIRTKVFDLWQRKVYLSAPININCHTIPPLLQTDA